MSKWNDPGWKRFERDVRQKLIPKIRDSASVLVLAPDLTTTKFDVEFAVQIGASVLLEKPLLVVVADGRTLPPKLERIADRIIYADLSTPGGQQQVEEQMKLFFADYERQ